MSKSLGIQLGKTYPHSCCQNQQVQRLHLDTWKDAQPQSIHAAMRVWSAQCWSEYLWDPYQKNLKSDIQIVQRRATRHIFHDFSHSTSASALITRLELQQLEAKRRADKVSMTYKVRNNLVDIAPTPGTLQPSNRTTRGQQLKLQVPYSRTNTRFNSIFPSAIQLWNSVPPKA